MLKENKTPIEIIIELFESELEQQENIDIEQIEKYIELKNKIDNNIFEFSKTVDLFYDTVSDKKTYKSLIDTLLFLENNIFIELTKEQIDFIKSTNVYKECMEKMNQETEKYKEILLKYKSVKEKNDDITYLIDLIKNKKNTIFDSTLLEKIYNIMKKYNFKKEKTIIIFKNLMLHINSLSYKQQKVTTYEPQITEDQLIEIFKKYGYDFKKVPKEFQTELLNGNLNNIEEMFQNMPQYGIEFSEKNNTHLYLILKSSKEALETIKTLSEKYGFDFLEILKKSPAPFMHKSSNNDTKKARANNPTEDKINKKSAFEDFCENIELINKLGYDIKTALKKTFSALIKPSTTIKRNIELLRQYDFFNGDNLAVTGCTLSALQSSTLYEIIDIFIELGELQYIKDNSSRLILDKDSYIITRLYFAKKNEDKLPNIKKIRAGKEMLTGIITKEENKKVDKYIDLKSIKHTIFDEELDIEIREFLKNALKELDNQTNIDDLEEIKLLDENYKKDNYIYDFNGTSISIKKVKRVYPVLLKEYPELDRKKLLLFAVTYNSLMSSEEFENISNIIISKEKRI